MVTRAPEFVRELLVDQPLKELGELYENSLKAMLVCGLEFYLSASLVASFFQCPDEMVQAEQELQTLYTLAWVPVFFAIILVYGPKISSSMFPSPENFERNMLRCKIFTWFYAFAFLIWDPDMVIKTGPSLGVSILFCITDIGRFIMDMKHLTDVEYDENGNSFIIHNTTPRQTEQEQKQEQEDRQSLQQPQQQSYTVHMIGGDSRVPPKRTGLNRQQGFQQLDASQQQLQQGQAQRASHQQGSSFDASHKHGNQSQLKQPHNGNRGQDLSLDKSPTVSNSEYVAVLEPTTDKELAELIAKKSFTYEF
ncbi:hypothetical protein KXD40_004001 [Peronospora effusa]|uniref:Uncharacterized protein n=1 Tax=Peronospora effusa TaxID=542832 RepID=A0A3M6VX26_9STRA|nr:hypothetical protein DD238_000378 [Peronospora effusa]UIZ23220.1 hypothetical protein KXD40_004001 [Peronospora effusa]